MTRDSAHEPEEMESAVVNETDDAVDQAVEQNAPAEEVASGGETGGASPRRPRRFRKRFALILALLIVLVGLPAYLVAQPQYAKRYTSLAPRYDSWHRSVHREVPCRKCHATPGVVGQSVWVARMVGDAYVSVVARGHEPVKLFERPANSSCRSCHMDLRTVSASGDLKIPHRAHVVVLKLRCVKCHRYLVHEASPEGNNKPRMATCLTCHNGRQAKDACATCHNDKAAPAGHKSPNWVVIHPTMQAKVSCPKCHAWTKNWCRDCHTRRPRLHGKDWRTKHGAKVAVRRNCEACHVASFCEKCHGEVPQRNFNPKLTLVK